MQHFWNAVPLLVLGIFVSVLFGILTPGLFRARHLRRLAARQGWSWEPGAADLAARHSDFPILRRRPKGNCTHVMRGEHRGWPIVAFDHAWDRNTRMFSAVIATGDVPMTRLLVQPAFGASRHFEAQFGDRIELESGEFNREFHVRCEDHRHAWDVLHPRVMECLLARPRFHIQFGKTGIIAWRELPFDPEDFVVAADLLSDLLDLMPRHVVEDEAQRSATA